MKQVISSFDRR